MEKALAHIPMFWMNKAYKSQFFQELFFELTMIFD